MLKKLDTIQKRNNLNEVYRTDIKGPGGGYHRYFVIPTNTPCMEIVEDDPCSTPTDALCEICFQNGPRSEESSIHGALDSDLLEIVRDRLKAFQTGEYATRENACAITHIEEALMWMNKRAEDRAARGVLGTMEK